MRRGHKQAGAAGSGGEIDDLFAHAFVRRGWAELERLDREHWARRWQSEGARATFGVSTALLAHVRRLRPDWPGEAERAADLQHHVAWKRLLENAARGLAGR